MERPCTESKEEVATTHRNCPPLPPTHCWKVLAEQHQQLRHNQQTIQVARPWLIPYKVSMPSEHEGVHALGSAIWGVGCGLRTRT